MYEEFHTICTWKKNWGSYRCASSIGVVVCGHIHYGKKALKVCPVCKHGQEYQSRLNSKK